MDTPADDTTEEPLRPQKGCRHLYTRVPTSEGSKFILRRCVRCGHMHAERRRPRA